MFSMVVFFTVSCLLYYCNNDNILDFQNMNINIYVCVRKLSCMNNYVTIDTDAIIFADPAGIQGRFRI